MSLRSQCGSAQGQAASHTTCPLITKGYEALTAQDPLLSGRSQQHICKPPAFGQKAVQLRKPEQSRRQLTAEACTTACVTRRAQRVVRSVCPKSVHGPSKAAGSTVETFTRDAELSQVHFKNEPSCRTSKHCTG